MTTTSGPFAADLPDLLQTHLDQLARGSGLTLDVIRDRGYRSILGRKELMDRGYARTVPLPGLLLPVWGPDGGNGLISYRPNTPTVDRRGRLKKYLLPTGASPRLDVPPRCRPLLADPAIPLYITEGQKKADALATHGQCAVALLGVWLFKGRNEHGGVTLLADFDYVAWKNAATGEGRTVYVVFDSDVMHKEGVRDALARLTEHLQRKGAVVTPISLPEGSDGTKVGVDDYLLTHPVTDLLALAQTPRPAPTAAPSVVEWLDGAPPTLDRPLALVAGHAYAATWLWARTTVRESIDKQGEVIRHVPPVVQNKHELIIVRDDGVAFGSGVTPMDELGLTVALSQPVRDTRAWRTLGVVAYGQGRRPDPADVFRRVASVFNHFIDFSRSLADQQGMCELSACLSLMTWLAPAFTVLPYPWPNGERGSGKTNWGICWAGTSYLGEVTTAGTTFAALRDLAAYGATILFDDAETLADPKKSDPDKRALLLAGNRRGAAIAVKEPQPDRTWVTHWLDAFCPRGFTAITLPDPVLASRSLIIPLVRTGDAKRGNADPADMARWPCDQRQLQDDLWATALRLLPQAATAWAALDNEDELVGREFEPWRAVLAVARLLEQVSSIELAGLEDRMRAVMRAYQREKADFGVSDRTMLVVRALLRIATDRNDGSDTSDTSDGMGEAVTFTAKQVADVIKRLAAQQAEGDDDTTADWASAERVGRSLTKLRLTSDTRVRARTRTATRADLLALARAYGVAPIEHQSTDAPIDNRHPRFPTVVTVATVATVDGADDVEVF